MFDSKVLRSTIGKALGALVLAASALGCAPAAPGGIAQVRFARATAQLDVVVAFYRDGLELPVLGGFEGHDGYDGVMIGLPGPERHLELTQSAVVPSRPGPEDLLVLYFPDRERRDAAAARLARMGYPASPPENPYWIDKAVTVADPDGFRVLLFHGAWQPSAELVPPRFRRKG